MLLSLYFFHKYPTMTTRDKKTTRGSRNLQGIGEFNTISSTPICSLLKTSIIDSTFPAAPSGI
jgi:hypothetical protein